MVRGHEAWLLSAFLVEARPWPAHTEKAAKPWSKMHLDQCPQQTLVFVALFTLKNSASRLCPTCSSGQPSRLHGAPAGTTASYGMAQLASGRSSPCAECKKTLNSSSFPVPAICCESKKGSRFFCDITNPSRILSEPMTSSKNDMHRITKEMKYNETVIKL